MATKPFAGKETKAEERAEGRMVHSGKMSPKAYVAAEKREGDKESTAELTRRGNDLKSGKLSPSAYANMEAKQGLKNGGQVKCMADGGFVGGSLFHAPNTPTGVQGPGVRSQQDYKK